MRLCFAVCAWRKISTHGQRTLETWARIEYPQTTGLETRPPDFDQHVCMFCLKSLSERDRGLFARCVVTDLAELSGFAQDNDAVWVNDFDTSIIPHTDVVAIGAEVRNKFRVKT